MYIESIRLKNFKSFRSVQISDIPRLCVVVGANGVGKTTLFSRTPSSSRCATRCSVGEAFVRFCLAGVLWKRGSKSSLACATG